MEIEIGILNLDPLKAHTGNVRSDRRIYMHI